MPHRSLIVAKDERRDGRLPRLRRREQEDLDLKLDEYDEEDEEEEEEVIMESTLWKAQLLP